ncbi:hypothetical protein QTN23_17795 [Pseudomonas shirazica]|uniref:hypothetical protein n=1 Tax=Pseudomonas shirazica TaxID=1940636 RepID=UPI0025A974DE|nr:hypothetical protein [Pseudomonas shirazica]MDM9601374.1 hypothetical protein [Pseudomonas shirazica]MDO2414760.1 hypothetical protein [Pseudomonas shirazica]
MKRTHLIDSVSVTDPSGYSHTVNVYEDEIFTSTLQGTRSTKGLKSYALANGNPVNFISEGKFYDVFGERTLTAA